MEPDQDTVQLSKPKTVTAAVYLIIAALLLGIIYALINAIANWNELARYYRNPFLPVCIAVDYLFAIFLAYKINQGRSWARLLYLLDPLFQTVDFVFNANAYRSGLPLTLFPIVRVIVEWNAVVLLFQSPANNWFKEQKTKSKKEKKAVAINQLDLTGPSPSPDAAASSMHPIPRHPPWPWAKTLTVAGAIGALLSLANPIFWTLYWSPQTANQREMIYVQLIAGFIVGAAWGAVSGAILLQLAYKNAKPAPLRWAMIGGILGGLLTFGCGFAGTILAFV